ncbi:MAG: hypothetical protein D6704_00245 [Nitrospirae bacterium]|nr:MAG: hypothetical protein D6704_00245 [Nitrospirota bacterium]
MPRDNNFLHAKYSRSDPGDRVIYRTFEPGAPVHSPAWQEAFNWMRDALQQANVRVILFLHGSYFGTDLFGTTRLDEAGGLKRGYSRGIPGLESLLAVMRPGEYTRPPERDELYPPFSNDDDTKRRLDHLARDGANFTTEYLLTFQQGLGEPTSSTTPLCVRYVWSSVHHHLGRLEAALALFAYLMELKQRLTLNSHHRLLILAHGHAGQLLALLSNLLSPGESTVRPTVVDILTAHAQQTAEGAALLAHLQRLEQFLTTEEWSTTPSLDVVTLGTPIRYGWDTSALGHLLHFVNHRPIRTDGKRWLAKMDLPQVAWELPLAAGGDYVQQLAIAGTDALPHSELDQATNHALRELLEPYDGFERWLECARRACRCPTDGLCRLIDYQDVGDDPRLHLFGHACYTRLSTMLFQAQEIVHAFYK